MEQSDRIASTVRSMAMRLDVQVDVAALEVELAHVQDLHGDELALIEQAVDRRRAEFATGRALLRRLLSLERPIGRTSTGAPAVPPGRFVSLAHDREMAVAVATADDSLTGIGIDVEPMQDLDEGLVSRIRRDDDAVDEPLAVFVAKEAVYKSWSAPGRRILEFHDVRLDIASDGRLSAHVFDDDTDIPVAVAAAADRWLALAARPARVSP